MSDRDRRLTRRGMVGGLALAVLGPHAATAETPLEGRLVRFDPPVPVPDVFLHDRHGRLAPLRSRSGRVGFLVLWATWCPACRTDLPRLAAIQSHLERSGIEVTAINVDADSLETVLARTTSLQTGGLRLLFDSDGRSLAAPIADGRRSPIQKFGMPILFVIDAAGLARGYVTGSLDWSDPITVSSLRAFAAMLAE